MKRAIALIVFMSFFLFLAMPAFAGELPKPVDKIVQGVTEVLKSPMALYDSPKAELDSHDNKVVGLFKGIVLAPFHLVDRAGHGLLKIITFPIE
jgi:hypothetical protein